MDNEKPVIKLEDAPSNEEERKLWSLNAKKAQENEYSISKIAKWLTLFELLYFNLSLIHEHIIVAMYCWS